MAEPLLLLLMQQTDKEPFPEHLQSSLLTL